MSFQYSFEKLDVWKESRALTKEVYLITNDFPANEMYGLVTQIRRAAISVASNISEGSGRRHGKEQKQFYNMAYSSLMELLNQLILSTDLGYLDDQILQEQLRPSIQSISFKLYKLQGSRD
jgi:four helix bundle protein